MIKNKIWTSGSKFETNSRGIKRKARMSPLASMQYRGHAATHTGINSKVGLSPGLLPRIPERCVLYCQNTKFGPGGGRLKTLGNWVTPSKLESRHPVMHAAPTAS